MAWPSPFLPSFHGLGRFTLPTHSEHWDGDRRYFFPYDFTSRLPSSSSLGLGRRMKFSFLSLLFPSSRCLLSIVFNFLLLFHLLHVESIRLQTFFFEGIQTRCQERVSSLFFLPFFPTADIYISNSPLFLLARCAFFSFLPPSIFST